MNNNVICNFYLPGQEFPGRAEHVDEDSEIVVLSVKSAELSH